MELVRYKGLFFFMGLWANIKATQGSVCHETEVKRGIALIKDVRGFTGAHFFTWNCISYIWEECQNGFCLIGGKCGRNMVCKAELFNI